MTTLTLPSGATATLRDPETLRAKHKKQVYKAISHVEQRVGATAVDMLDGCIAVLVTAWTCTDEDGQPLPIPSEDIEAIDEIDADDYEALTTHPSITALAERVSKARTVTPDDHADPTSPTEPSAA